MTLEMRRAARMAMRGVPERLGLEFARGNVEMRAKPNGTGGTAFTWEGYATVFDAPFDMWDQDGEPFKEVVAPGAATRSLANPNLDVPFLIGHNSAGIPLARTKSGTMQLSQDSHGVLTYVPSMDGRREEVRALASAVERHDLDEMSLAFVCTGDRWDADYEQRTITGMELHRGDVCAVTHGANPATAGAMMRAVEQLAFRRPAAIGGPRLLVPERRAAMSVAEQHGHPGQSCYDPDGDGDCDLTPEGDTDHDYWSADGKQIKPLPGQDQRAAGIPYELLSVTQAERDKAKAAGNSLPDGSYPINNVAQLHSAAVLAASHHGDWKAAQALIRRRAKELGVDVTTLPGFGEEKADGRPVELRASAFESTDLEAAPDIDAAAADHEQPCKTCGGKGRLPHPVTGKNGAVCPGCAGTGAVVTVDDVTGIPGPEMQMSAARRLELRLRDLDLQELAYRR